MSGSINKVIIIGNLGRDPEVRRMNSGDSVVSFSVATTESWKDKSGERQERVTWHNIVVFNEGLGKVAEAYCKKGSKVYIEGQLETRKWQDQSGADRYTTEVVLRQFRGELTLLGGRDGAARSGGEERGGYDDAGYGGSAWTGGGSRGAPAGAKSGGRSDLDDEIPF